MGTIIGSPPNLIAIGTLEDAGIEVSFLDWMIYGLPLAFLLEAISCFVLIWIYIKDTKAISLDFLQNQPPLLSNKDQAERFAVIVIIAVTIILWLTHFGWIT